MSGWIKHDGGPCPVDGDVNKWLAIVALTLTGCSTVGPGNDDLALKVLGNLEHCDRQYTMALGMGASGSMIINCRAKPYPQ